MKCCEQYAAALSAFVDGELSENEKEEVLSHVEHCQNCREYLSELMIVHTMFEEMPELDAPEGFSERVLGRVHEEKRARSRHRRAWPRVLAACFALLVVTAAAWKLAPAMASKSDSAANETADNGSAMDNTVGGAANDGYSYTYAAVQKDSALADEDFLYEGVPENSTADRSADADDDYTVITLDLPEAADFLREHGMAVYVEAEDSVSYLVVPETAHELSEALPLDEEEKAALAAAEELVIVEVAKAEEAPAENNAAEEEGNT